jgi:pimeloyl-ACP methyl ester carboxylesterase
MPITVVLGDLDSSDITEVAHRIVKQARQAELVTIPNAGRMLNLEQLDRFAEILLASIPSGR